MLRSVVIIVISALVYASNIQAKEDACAHINNLRKSFRAKPFIFLQFTQTIASDVFETVDTTTGRLWAGENGRFRLKTSDQEMVSNGILYWSYSKETNQVLVDSIAGMGDWDPLTILYDPENMYECASEEVSKSKITFSMQAVDSLTEPESFRMTVSKSEYIPKSLEYRDENGSRIFIDINEFEHKSEFPDSIFNFVPPSGVEIILMP